LEHKIASKSGQKVSFMSEFVLKQQNATTAPQQIPQERIRRLVWKLCAATLILMAIGSATRVMNAGLACPDWPLCYGELVPTKQMNFQVFLEWFHRLDAALIGIGAIALVAISWWHRQSLPRWLPWASTFALFLIGTALLFFITLLVIGSTLTLFQGTGTVGYLPWVGLTSAILVYLQSILGALVGSRWALHQCFGGSQLCTVMYSHIIGVVPPTVATLAVVFLSWRTPALHPTLRRLANIAGGLLIIQLLLGVATFRLHLQVEPLTVSHQAVGACLLGSLVVFTVLALRDWASSRGIDSYPESANANPTN
jgi:heme a synthase